ncbi:sulfotransferase family 2 domain-containing protein [bacterium]|nr:sulfotransferase family 2 domain-containing protein [bacterium]
MIISHKHKFIFLKPYKVAGSSFEFALSSILGSEDLVTYLGPDEEKKRLKESGVRESGNKKPLVDIIKNFSRQNKRDLKSLRWPRLFHPHASAEEVRDFLGQTVWDEYTKISIIRNPWDYLLSFYHWNYSGETRKPFEGWVFDNRHLVGQNNYQYYCQGTCVIDIFLRFERLLDCGEWCALYLSAVSFQKSFKETAGRSAHTHKEGLIRQFIYPPFNPPYGVRG